MQWLSLAKGVWLPKLYETQVTQLLRDSCSGYQGSAGLEESINLLDKFETILDTETRFILVLGAIKTSPEVWWSSLTLWQSQSKSTMVKAGGSWYEHAVMWIYDVMAVLSYCVLLWGQTIRSRCPQWCCHCTEMLAFRCAAAFLVAAARTLLACSTACLLRLAGTID